jgi:hypothetical protein
MNYQVPWCHGGHSSTSTTLHGVSYSECLSDVTVYLNVCITWAWQLKLFYSSCWGLFWTELSSCLYDVGLSQLSYPRKEHGIEADVFSVFTPLSLGIAIGKLSIKIRVKRTSVVIGLPSRWRHTDAASVGLKGCWVWIPAGIFVGLFVTGVCQYTAVG